MRKEPRMFYEMIEDRLQPGDYRVEAINSEGDGEVYTAIFVGPDARERAEEYANWKNVAVSEPLRKAS
jgi:hypothetical protein